VKGETVYMSILSLLLAQAGLTAVSDVQHLGNGVYQVYVQSVPQHRELADQLHKVGLNLYGYGQARGKRWEVRFCVNMAQGVSATL
jgi:hypothetical protein